MSATFYREVLDALTDGVYFVDPQRNITYWNKAAERISGYAGQEVLGRCCGDNILRHVDESGTELCKEGCPLEETIEDGKVRESTVFMHHKLGHRDPVFVRAAPMRDDKGEIIGAVEIFRDSSRKLDALQELEKLRKETLTDPLTGVGNRRFAELTMGNLDISMSESLVQFGILFADIDHFKNVNDTYGHQVGDQVLRMVAQSLASSLRALDAACRWGGEEFVIFVPNTTTDALKSLARRLRMLVERSWLDVAPEDGGEEERVAVTVSIGGALSCAGEGAAAVLERADKNLYLSKSSGRNCVHCEGELCPCD